MPIEGSNIHLKRICWPSKLSDTFSNSKQRSRWIFYTSILADNRNWDSQGWAADSNLVSDHNLSRRSSPPRANLVHVGIMDKQCVCEKVRITLAYSSEVQRRYFKADCLANHDQQLDFLYYPLADTFRLFHGTFDQTGVFIGLAWKIIVWLSRH